MQNFVFCAGLDSFSFQISQKKSVFKMIATMQVMVIIMIVILNTSLTIMGKINTTLMIIKMLTYSHGNNIVSQAEIILLLP